MEIPVVSPEPKVTLIAHHSDPIRTSAAAAITCYSHKGASSIVFPHEPKDERVTRTFKDCYDSGHQIFSIPSFAFGLENVSRNFVHDVLHLNLHYASDQVSQRYVTNKEAAVRMPPFNDPYSTALAEKRFAAQWKAYQETIPLLESHLREIKSRSKGRLSGRDEQLVPKQSIEIARYVLPVAALSGLYHSINLSTLYRLVLTPEITNTPWEARLVAQKMMGEVKKVAPDAFDHIGQPLKPEDTPTYQGRKLVDTDVTAYNEKFDNNLGGFRAKLVSSTPNGDDVLADAVRTHLAASDALSDEDAVGLVMSPATNRTLLHPIEPEHFDGASYAMGQVT
ncbi:MAG: FAD-dependent thymidylate synthase, partial [Candidatus Aenigmarchaeota archaeon]|nr:FAD-dependent thymidylate synthase [Candidatus Aenigmarchaeota archaeon]